MVHQTNKRKITKVVNIGDVFGRLIVIEILDNHYVKCSCSCGNKNETNVYKYSLLSGNTSSCGCLAKEKITNLQLKHGFAPKNKKEPIYNIWCSMKRRCYAINCKEYEYYGNRNIIVCDQWKHSFEQFKNWAYDNGYKTGLEIDRIDVNGNYEPSNCRFVTHQQNCCNQRSRKNSSSCYKGVSLCSKKWKSEITKNKIRYNLGSFDSEMAAAIMYNKKAQELFHEFANLNYFDNINTLVLCAGEGKRFKDYGYENPKPLIDVDNKYMLERVYETNSINCQHIFAIRKEHIELFHIDKKIKEFCPKPIFIEIENLTRGAAETALLSKQFIDNDKELIIYNSDQLIDCDFAQWREYIEKEQADGAILTFKAIDKKWSYARINESGIVTEVKEKQVISDNATVGWYWYKKGSDFVRYAEQMIESNDRFNNEFYVCPVYNYFIKDGKKIVIFQVEQMIGLGTPEDLKIYLEEKKNVA